MPPNHLILYCPFLLLPSIFPRIRGFSNESVLCIRWPKYWMLWAAVPAPKLSARRARLCGAAQRGHQRPSLGIAHPSQLGLRTALLSAHPGSPSPESTHVPLGILSHFERGKSPRKSPTEPSSAQAHYFANTCFTMSAGPDGGTTHTGPGTAPAQAT